MPSTPITEVFIRETMQLVTVLGGISGFLYAIFLIRREDNKTKLERFKMEQETERWKQVDKHIIEVLEDKVRDLVEKSKLSDLEDVHVKDIITDIRENIKLLMLYKDNIIKPNK